MRAVELVEYPDCDFCHAPRAKYDGPTLRGPHGFMCETCLHVFGYPTNFITRRLYVQATHHGPWCDEEGSIWDELCPRCRAGDRPGEVLPDRGLWLLFRLTVHWYLHRSSGGRAQQVLDIELNGADWTEIMRIQLDMLKAGRGG